jgi:hypothetical protein
MPLSFVDNSREDFEKNINTRIIHITALAGSVIKPIITFLFL